MQLFIENLTCERGGRILFRDLTFTLSEGEGMLLEGPNGAGKTSLIRIIAGYLPPDEGRVRIEGLIEDTELTEQIHYVGHKNGLKSNFTVAETVKFWKVFLENRMTGPVNKDNSNRSYNRPEPSISHAIEVFGLNNLMSVPAGLLSAGQKRRLSLSRLLLVNRPIWLLDEPSHGLDAASQQVLADTISEHISAGGTVIATTHTPLGVEFGKFLDLSREGVAL